VVGHSSGRINPQARKRSNPGCGILLSASDDEKLPEILTVDEVRKLLVSARAMNHTWFPVWAVALTTGMRSSELYALRKENVLLKEGLIRITESWDWLQNRAKSTKAGYWRNAPIPSSLLPVIEPLMKTEGEFLLPRIQKWEEGLQALVLRSFCQQIGISSVRFHALRVCFATHLLAGGVEDAKVMRIGGWRDFKTFQVYVRLAGIREKGLSEGLGQVILPTDQSVLEHLATLYNGNAQCA
jgi:integrase